jgi:hypothetical protein
VEDDPFVSGPFRWLIARLARFDHVLLWPADEEQDSRFSLSSLDLRREKGCRALWNAAVGVSEGFSDVLVSDVDCREVYRLHHHDKIEAYIPDGAARQEMLDGLARRPDLFEDCSGYMVEWDDEKESEDDEA